MRERIRLFSRLCCTPVGTENPLGLLSPARDKALEKSLNRAVLLDLGLEVLSEAGNHFAGHRAGDLLLRRLPSRMVLLNEESFIESLDYCVGFLCHKFLESVVVDDGQLGDQFASCRHREDVDVGGVGVFMRLQTHLYVAEDCSANFAVDFHCS